LRDGNTRIDPHRWCLPGGHVEQGEDSLAAAHRELLEETGLKVEELRLFWRGLAPSASFPGAVGEFTVFYAATGAADGDVVCGEGAAMRFVDPATVAGLEFGAAYAEIVPRFLASPQYRALVTA
jgi:8-oxo-dGTP pyrophosphatase MutT (NUDIX family)